MIIIPGSPRAFFWDDILAAPVQHHDVRVDACVLCQITLSILEKKHLLQTAVKKNKQPKPTPGGPGRLRSWSGPVETDFQGRLRFRIDNIPVQHAIHIAEHALLHSCCAWSAPPAQFMRCWLSTCELEIPPSSLAAEQRCLQLSASMG